MAAVLAKTAELGAAVVQTGGCQGWVGGLCPEGHHVVVVVVVVVLVLVVALTCVACNTSIHQCKHWELTYAGTLICVDVTLLLSRVSQQQPHLWSRMKQKYRRQVLFRRLRTLNQRARRCHTAAMKNP